MTNTTNRVPPGTHLSVNVNFTIRASIPRELKTEMEHVMKRHGYDGKGCGLSAFLIDAIRCYIKVCNKAWDEDRLKTVALSKTSKVLRPLPVFIDKEISNV